MEKHHSPKFLYRLTCKDEELAISINKQIAEEYDSVVQKWNDALKNQCFGTNEIAIGTQLYNHAFDNQDFDLAIKFLSEIVRRCILFGEDASKFLPVPPGNEPIKKIVIEISAYICTHPKLKEEFNVNTTIDWISLIVLNSQEYEMLRCYQLFLDALSAQEQKQNKKVKKISIACVAMVVLLFLVSTFSSSGDTNKTPSSSYAQSSTYYKNAYVTVYITDTGEKYHTSGCQYLSKSKYPIELYIAVEAGYGRCSKCHPPKLQEYN